MEWPLIIVCVGLALNFITTFGVGITLFVRVGMYSRDRKDLVASLDKLGKTNESIKDTLIEIKNANLMADTNHRTALKEITRRIDEKS